MLCSQSGVAAALLHPANTPRQGAGHGILHVIGGGCPVPALGTTASSAPANLHEHCMPCVLAGRPSATICVHCGRLRSCPAGQNSCDMHLVIYTFVVVWVSHTPASKDIGCCLLSRTVCWPVHVCMCGFAMRLAAACICRKPCELLFSALFLARGLHQVSE